MMGKTHRIGGTAAMLVTFDYMSKNGMLLEDVHPLLQLAVMYPAASFGSLMPDYDHHWQSTPAKTPFTWVFHKLLHLTSPKHRSWQTHSLLVTGGFLFLLYALVQYGQATWGGVDWIIIQLMVYGFITGVLSHLFLDALSTAGIFVYPGLKLRFVPKSSMFATDTKWERLVFATCVVISVFFALSITLGVFDISLIETIKGYITRGSTS